ncbi:MAG: hypothetical protein E7623_03190 [Ruminococcaceae bacterium]|nr:hypothetical protein [Oscillospiraceae bacterium]
MKRIISLLVVLAFVVLAFAACDPKSKTDDENLTESETETESGTETEAEVAVLNASITADAETLILDLMEKELIVDGTQHAKISFYGKEYDIPVERYVVKLEDKCTVYFDTETLKFVCGNNNDVSDVKPPVFTIYGEKVEANVSYLLMAKDSRLAEKTCATFGDSITWYDGNPYNWGKEQGKVAVGYQSYMRKYLGMKVSNYGYSGYTMPQIIRMLKVTNISKFDYITITSGANDERCATPLGEIAEKGSKFDSRTYIGALQSGIEHVLKKNENAKILLIAPIGGWFYAPHGYDTGKVETKDGIVEDKWAKAMKEVAELYDLPFCDLYTEGGFNIDNRIIYMNDPEPNRGNNLYSLHPSSIGYIRMASVIMRDLLKYFA